MSLRAEAGHNFARHIGQNSYPGRGLVLGRSSDGAAWLLLVNDALTFIRGTARLPRPNYGPYVWRVAGETIVGEPVAAFQVGRRIADLLLCRSVKAAAPPAGRP